MFAFPAEIPAPEARRADVVEVRVARNVAPLFGLGADIGPFRHSWVGDFTELSLAEIGRGAPFPDRVARSQLDADAAAAEPAGWAWSGRAVWSAGPLPGGLSNATLNRYGPDTKAAAVLAAANRLLRGATTAVGAVCRELARTGCDAEVRLAVWAGLVLEVYRAQPALVVAAIQARQVQRSLSTRWGAQVDPAGVSGAGAPSEIHPAGDVRPDVVDQSTRRWRPTTFDLVDLTLPELGLADDGPDGLGLVTVEAVDDIASAWCHRLLGIGRPGRGVVWLAEDADQARRVYAMVRVGAVVAPFVVVALGGSGPAERDNPPDLPNLPEPSALAALPLSHRRAHLLVAHVAASYLRYRDELLLAWPQLRAGTRQLVADAVRRSETTLAPDDPVAVQLRAYQAYLAVWDLRRDSGGKRRGGDPVAALMESQAALMSAWQAGQLDPGALAYLLEIGLVALTDSGAQDRVTPMRLRRWWSAILQARGLTTGDPSTLDIERISDAQVFHLHHYAAWLASKGRPGDLRRALALQQRVAAVRAEVTRREPARFAAKSAAARSGHELAAQIAADLVQATPAGQAAALERAARTAADSAGAVLADPSTRQLLLRGGAQPATVRAALVVTRALHLAATHGVPVSAERREAAGDLVDAVLAAPGAAPAATLRQLRHWRAALVAPPAD